MTTDPRESREAVLKLLEVTRAETRALLSGLDPERVIHTDERAWRVRDILGHIAVWNAEAARSLQAYAQGSEYLCIDSEAEYDHYNGLAAAERSAWPMEKVWAEYESAHDELVRAVELITSEKWGTQMLYPWNQRGTPGRLIRIMMHHEGPEHCALVRAAIT